MVFINLSEALISIANHINLEPHLDSKASHIGEISREAADNFWLENNPKIEWARKFSFAALFLNKALHDSNTPPQWLAFDAEKRFPIRTNSAREDGIELLTYATSWGNRRQRNCASHFKKSITQGDEALSMEVIETENDAPVPREKFMQFANIGFDRAELVAFLNNHQIEHDLLPQAGEANAEIKADSASNAPKAAVPEVENQQKRQARRWELCIKAGLAMPTDTYAQLPRGIGLIAKAEGITRQALSQDLNAYRERLYGK